MHLIVLHHGLWGNHSHLDRLIETIKVHLPDKEFEFVNIDTSPGTKTYDGIDVCGDRVFSALQPFLKRATQISFIGYSLGGLVLRYVIGRLEQQGVFKTVKPMNYISLATPHLGSRRRDAGYGVLFNHVVQKALHRTGQQLALRDHYHGSHLLVVMADPAGVFYKGLQRFKLGLFANIANDFSVPFTTAAIEPSFPYSRFQLKLDAEFPCIATVDHHPKQGQWTLNDYKKVGFFVLISPLLIILLPVVALRLTYANYTHQPETPIPWLDSTHKHPENPRKWICDQLNQLEWTKVHVNLTNGNAHAAMVLRKPFTKGVQECIPKYLAEKMFIY